MQNIEIETRVIRAVKECANKEVKITKLTSLGTDLHLDSWEQLELIADIEVEFGIDIPEALLVPMPVTVGDLVAIVKKVVK